MGKATQTATIPVAESQTRRLPGKKRGKKAKPKPKTSPRVRGEPLTIVWTHLESKAAEAKLLMELLDLRNFPKMYVDMAVRYVMWLTDNEWMRPVVPDIYDELGMTKYFYKLMRVKLDEYGLIKYARDDNVVVLDWEMLRQIKSLPEETLGQLKYRPPYLEIEDYRITK